ncbi:putative carboxypeptidase D [Dioscorea sansibarensis]
MRMRSSQPLVFAIVVLISLWRVRARSPFEVQEKERVVNLPGQPNVNFAHYSGYVTVNKESGRSLSFGSLRPLISRRKNPCFSGLMEDKDWIFLLI